MKKQLLTGVSVLLAGLLGAIWFVMPMGETDGSKGSSEASERPEKESSSDGRTAGGRMTGVYSLDYDSVVSAAGGDLLRVKLKGDLNIVPLPENPRVSYLGFSGEIEVLAGGQKVEGVQRELTQPVFVESYDKMPSILKGTEKIGEISRGVWLMLDSFSRARPKPGVQEEYGALGVCRVEYRMTGVGKFERRRTSCSPAQGPDAEAIRKLESTQTFELGEGNMVTKSQLSELVESGGERIPELKSTTKISVHRIGGSSLPGAALKDFANAKTLVRDRVQLVRELDMGRIGNRTLAGVLATTLQEVESAEGELSHAQRNKLGREFVALAAMIRQDPDALAKVVEHIESDGPLSSLLIDALRDGGTPEAQDALSKLLRETDRAPNERLHLTRALSLTAAPTAATVATLSDHRKDGTVGEQATYGLGTAARRLRETDPELARSTVEGLRTQLSEAPTSYVKAAVLKSLGNAGATEIYPEVREALEDPDSQVRGAAVSALRRVDAPEVERKLIHALEDHHYYVRQQAVLALSERKATDLSATAIAAFIRSETAFQQLSAGIALAGDWLKEGFEILRPPLEELASSADASDAIRKAAAAQIEQADNSN